MADAPSSLSKRQVQHSGLDRSAWRVMTIFCCGDCGWYSTDRRECAGCGQPAAPVPYERAVLSDGMPSGFPSDGLVEAFYRQAERERGGA
jgi:hypothetical protein